MTTVHHETRGVRQLAVLAAVAAATALLVLLIGTVVSGLAGRSYGVLLVFVSLAFVGVALFGGWAPGLYLGLSALGVGAIVAGDDLTWIQALALAITLSVVHETSRFSLDARKPTRLGAGLLRRTSFGVLVGTSVAIGSGLIIRRFLAEDPSAYWVPAGIASIGLLLFAARWFELGASRLPIGSGRAANRISLLVAVVASVAVVVVVALGATHRAAARVDRVSERVDTIATDADLSQLYPEQVSGSLATLFGMFLAAALLGLLYGALNRRQLLLVQDDIDFDLDDSRFSLSLPDPAEFEDAGLDVTLTAKLIEALLADLDSEPDPGRAIRFSYARVEQQLADIDLAPLPSETAHEFLRRALPTLDHGAGHQTGLAQLTTLFEQARFSEDPVTETMRGEARRALRALQEVLRQ